MSEKIDLKKALKYLYKPSAKAPKIVEIPSMKFLLIDGTGNPNTSKDYQAAVEALYGVSYSLKFTSKKELGRDYVVMPLEGLWWGTPMGKHEFSEEDKDKFKWTMMVMHPDFITQEQVKKAIEQVERKKGLKDLDQLRFEAYKEGLKVKVINAAKNIN